MLIVFDTPAFQDNARFLQITENFAVQLSRRLPRRSLRPIRLNSYQRIPFDAASARKGGNAMVLGSDER